MVFREVLFYKGKESVCDIGTDVFAEGGLYQRMLFRCLLFVCKLWMILSVDCTGIRILRVLFVMEKRLGGRMLCRIRGMTVFC